MVRRRHSLLWKLALLQVCFCLVLVWVVWIWGLQLERSSYFLSAPERALLEGYAEQAEQVAQSRDPVAVEHWRQQMMAREHTWFAVLDARLQSLGTEPLTVGQVGHLTYMRKTDWPMSRRLQDELPFVSIEFPRHPEQGRLVLQLPERLLPGGLTPWTHLLSHGVLPAVLALVLGVLLYRLVVVPLADLRERANALRGDDLESGLGSHLALRRDELGELAQAFDHMALRLRQSLAQQRQMLRALSHEIRTPLARLRIASESRLPVEQLQQRLEREIDDMQKLVDDSLDLAWLDAERPQLPKENVPVLSVWEALCVDACFESGWPASRLVCELGSDCVLHIHLDSFAQALENLLRNAIRHSPADGVVRLHGQREGACWLLSLDDQGPGVAQQDLQAMFEPFRRLEGTTGKGFGLGLSIARKAIELQGGQLWASRLERGLSMKMRLPAIA